MPENQLFYGDNLEVLRRHVQSESVDLTYLDPPFNSKQDYNVLFAEQDGSRSAAQIKAFGDTWRWDQGAEAACLEMIEAGGKISIAIQALRQLLGSNDMMAYVAMMAPRLIELHRVLKPTGIDEDLSGLSQHQKLDRLLDLGHITIVPGEAWPIYQHYVKPSDGTPVSDLWTFQPYTSGTVYETENGVDEDIRWLSTKDQERLGYPTQKPESLLDRIIKASSDKGQTVLDPFCGCGTATASAQRLGRRWIGIDITHLAIALIKHRLRDAFGESIVKEYAVLGEPVSLPDAQDLADSDPYQFQWWALGLVHARPVEGKKGADKGIDGRIFFHEGDTTKTTQIIFSVKAGHTGPAHVRDLRGVLEREKAAIGVLITMRKPTKPMRTEAAEAGFYTSTWGKKKHPRIQILTIAELLEGKTVDAPPMRQVVTFKKAPKAKKGKATHQPEIDFESEEEDETPW